jgi:hypothetical protein
MNPGTHSIRSTFASIFPAVQVKAGVERERERERGGGRCRFEDVDGWRIDD